MTGEHPRAAAVGVLAAAAVWCMSTGYALLARVLPDSWEPWATFVPSAVALGVAAWLGVKAYLLPRQFKREVTELRDALRNGTAIAVTVGRPEQVSDDDPEPTYSDWGYRDDTDPAPVADQKADAALHGMTASERTAARLLADARIRGQR